MAADFGPLSGQSTGGRTIALSTTPATLHTIPVGETHDITVLANSTSAVQINIKPAGDSTGLTETLEANKNRMIYTGPIKNATGGALTVTAVTVSGTACAWGKYRKLA